MFGLAEVSGTHSVTKGRIVSRTEVSCATTVRADSIVAQPLTITVHTVENTYKLKRIGRHTRKSKGKTYSSPRLLLGAELDSYVGTRCRIFKAKASITGQYHNLINQDVLIVVLFP